MAPILWNGGSQSPDRWLKEPRNNHIICPYGKAAYRFELTVTPEEKPAVSLPAEIYMATAKGGE